MNRSLIINIFLTLVSILSVTGCINGNTELEQRFTQFDGMHLSVKGDVVLEYNTLYWQCAFSPSSAEFKVCEDNMRDYYILRCNRVPATIGDKVSCDLEWTTYSDVKERKNLDFRLVKADPDTGIMWLWCSSARIGAAVKEL